MGAVVLDSGAVTRLASRDRLSAARIGSLARRGIWPPVVPSVVRAECLTGRQSIDAVTNRFLKGCDIEEQLPEQVARNAGRLRDRTGRASEISAVDADQWRHPAMPPLTVADTEDGGALVLPRESKARSAR